MSSSEASELRRMTSDSYKCLHKYRKLNSCSQVPMGGTGQEFVAHGASVNFLALGQKSGHVMVTGGEDRKVNLWTVGKPNCILSLTGHTTPVESVRFGNDEEMVIAGSMSGAIKIWNLEEAKIIRTLTGHKSSIKSLDFHPYGDYAASGSLDCNIKLWDIRRKGCIYTYKGHTASINCLRFSPDGKWIASAGEDGSVKLWDLTAGRMLTELSEHTGPVNVVEFHPNELLIASGSSDRTIKFWDLETFKMVSSTDGDSTPIRQIRFHPKGGCLFSGGRDLMKVYGWEPSKCYDSIPLGWGEVADMAVSKDQLISASFSQTNVSTYVVNLQRVQPFGGVPYEESSADKDKDANIGSHNSMSHNSGRKNFITERPRTQSSRQASIPKEEVEEPTHNKDEGDDNESSADIQDPKYYNEIFKPKSRISRSPPRKVEPFEPPVDVSGDMFPVHQSTPKVAPSKPQTKMPTKSPARSAASVPKVEQKVEQKNEPVVQKTPKKETSPPSRSPARKSPPIQRKSSPPPGIAAEDFLPKSKKNGPKGEPSELEVIDNSMRGHSSMLTVMSARSKNIQIVRAMWTTGNIKTAVDSAISMKDKAVLVDLLNVLNHKPGLWNLDLCALLLPHIKDLLNDKYNSYVTTGIKGLKIILKNFGPVIKANLTNVPSIGVDISREERYRKCNSCYVILSSIRGEVVKKQNFQGDIGVQFRELQLLLSTLD